MDYIYYCKKCRKTFSTEGSDATAYCPNCSTRMIFTDLPLSDWREKSDEEKEALKQGFDRLSVRLQTASSEGSNKIGRVLGLAGWIFIALSLLGGFMIAVAESGIAGFLTALMGALGGLLLLGFGEIIHLLQDIKNK